MKKASKEKLLSRSESLLTCIYCVKYSRKGMRITQNASYIILREMSHISIAIFILPTCTNTPALIFEDILRDVYNL